MTTGIPELGSKISLISKADIRYEGRLFTVDPQECTIALASVRSFGTEDRETQYHVPAQNQVYDYILFRGSDIKDIRVVNNVTHPHPQPLNDPAIMQLSVPASLGGQPFQNHPVLGPMAPQMGQFAGAYGNIGPLGGMGMQGQSRGLGNSKPNLIGGSRSTTPVSLSSRKSPTTDQGVQAGSSKRDDKKAVKPIQPPGQRNQQRRTSRERKDSRGEAQNQNRSGGNRNQNQQTGYQAYQGYQGTQTNQRGTNWGNSRGQARPRGRPRSGFRPMQNQGNQAANNKPKNTLKFENDYDFEQANTEFEELRSQLGKVKLDEAGSTSTKSEVNGDVDKKDDSGNETGAGETEQDEDHEVYYDKTKSFFDKISCEAVERAKGKSQRTDWRVERKLNSETFGVAATRRVNYRGRGGFRGGNYRGGFRGSYRPPQRRDQQPQQQQQQGNQNQRQQNPLSSAAKPGLGAAAQSISSNSTKSATPAASGAKKEKNPEPAMAVK